MSGRDGDGSRSVWFGYPITVRTEAPFSRDDLVRFLEARGIETRPIMAGNFQDQPAIQLFEHRIAGPLPNAALIMRQSFFIGNHHAMGEGDRRYVKECVDEFMSAMGVKLRDARVLVTGGAGFLGRHVVEQLEAAGVPTGRQRRAAPSTI